MLLCSLVHAACPAAEICRVPHPVHALPFWKVPALHAMHCVLLPFETWPKPQAGEASR